MHASHWLSKPLKGTMMSRTKIRDPPSCPSHMRRLFLTIVANAVRVHHGLSKHTRRRVKLGRRRPLQASDLYPLARGTSSTEQADKFETAYNQIVSGQSTLPWLFKWKGGTCLRALSKALLGWEFHRAPILKSLWLGSSIAQVFCIESHSQLHCACKKRR